SALPNELKPHASAALERIKSPDQAAVVLPLLKGDVAQRVAALRALGAMANKAQAGAVVSMLSDPHPSVRREAVTAVARLAADAERQSHAIEMLRDADATVRQAAAQVLTPTPSTAALSALADQLGPV